MVRADSEWRPESERANGLVNYSLLTFLPSVILADRFRQSRLACSQVCVGVCVCLPESRTCYMTGMFEESSGRRHEWAPSQLHFDLLHEVRLCSCMRRDVLYPTHIIWRVHVFVFHFFFCASAYLHVCVCVCVSWWICCLMGVCVLKFERQPRGSQSVACGPLWSFRVSLRSPCTTNTDQRVMEHGVSKRHSLSRVIQRWKVTNYITFVHCLKGSSTILSATKKYFEAFCGWRSSDKFPSVLSHSLVQVHCG